MRIQTPLVDIKDQLINFISEGYGIMGEAFMNSYNSEIPNMQQMWENRVVEYLGSIFPTKKETGQFLHTPYLNRGYGAMHVDVANKVDKTDSQIKILEQILVVSPV